MLLERQRYEESFIYFQKSLNITASRGLQLSYMRNKIKENADHDLIKNYTVLNEELANKNNLLNDFAIVVIKIVILMNAKIAKETNL